MMVLKNKWKNRFILILFMVGFVFLGCIYNHRTTKTNQKYPSVNL